MNILVLYGTHEAPAIQDIYFNNPFKVLESSGKLTFNVVDLNDFQESELVEYNLIIISRVFIKEVLEIIELCKKTNRPVLFFFDDDILNFPEEYYLNNEPFYKNNEQLIIDILKSSCGLIVSTEILKKSYLKYNPVIHVTPPCIDINFIDNNLSKSLKERPKKEFTIGYAGSFGHVIDFRFMENALLDFYKKHSPNIRIEFMGCIPEAFQPYVNDENISLIHWQQNYEVYLKNILNANWDLALCPVIDSSYTSHKTNIKFIEYSAAAIPGIYSDIEIYSKDAIDAKNAFLANNNAKSWGNKLDFVYNNRHLLSEISVSSNNYVREKFSSIKSAENWQYILSNYKKRGVTKISEALSIKLFKAKRIYSQEGFQGVLSRVSTSYSNRNIPASRAEQRNQQVEKILEKLSSNFDNKIIKKQVLFIVPWLSVGGGDMVNLTIVENLDKEQYTLHFITTEISKHEWELKFRKNTQNILHVRNVIKKAAYFWEYNNLILAYVEKAKIDTIIISNSAIGYNCIPALKEKFNHIKIIDILHGQGGEKEGGGFPAYSKPYDPYIDKRITINNYLKKYLVNKYNIGEDRIQVISNCIDTDKFSKKRDSYKKRLNVAFIGRLSYEKHPETVVDIAELIRTNHPSENIHFQIIGDGPLYPSLLKVVEERKLSSSIFLAGYKDNIQNELKTIDVLILCSEMEGLPIVLLEAMSMGIPCIATNVGGIPELIDNDDNGFLIDFSSDLKKQFAEKLVFLNRNTGRRKEMGLNARKKVVSQFSVSTMSKAYADLLK